MISFNLDEDEWCIESDSHQWKLGKVFYNKNGEKKVKYEKYFTSLKNLLNNLYELKIRESDYSSFEELKNNMISYKDQIIGQLVGHFPDQF